MHISKTIHKNRLVSKTDQESVTRNRISGLIIFLAFIFIITGLYHTPSVEIINGLYKIITSPGILITDYIALANIGAAFINAAIMCLIGLGLAWLVNARFNGALLAAIFTLTGFAFFGKNPLNTLPIIFGVIVYSKISHQPLRELIAPLLFGTTIAPVVSQLAFGFNFGTAGIVSGFFVGIMGGFLVTGLMRHVYNFHLGYNLYNIGTTGGFVALAFYMIMRGFGLEIEQAFYWSTEYTSFLFILFSIISLLMIMIGLFWGAKWSTYKSLLKESGKLPSDYVDKTDLGTTIVNMGLLGLICLGYIYWVKGDFNGPVIAGVMTTIGFGGLGKHPRNALPVILGVYLICIPKIWHYNDPGPLLAALFCPTLAPFAGKFGFLAGLIAGMLHLPMVMHVGSLHGFMNLYNNGFAGGLVMLIIIGLIKGLKPDLLTGE